VELQVLKAIEKELGSNLRIQHFLDLIVGTSTGGIIALGLGVRNWSVDECIRHFKYLCKEAFQPRELVGIPLLERMAVLNHGSMYKTSPFQAMLKQTFKSKPLFGDTDQDTMAPIKVAITTATSVDQHPVVLANYNRLDPADYELPYEFHRPDLMSREFKVWEAARATSAAPPFFKFFTKEDTSATYMDGAFYHNNPVRVAHHEQRLLTDEKPPDILISLGTGKNAEIMEKSAEPVVQDGNNQRDSLSGGNLQRLYRIVAERFDYLLECNRIWKDFVAEMAVSDSSSSSSASSLRRRMIRINPDLKAKVPRLDAVDQVDVIEDATKRYMRSVPAKTREIAHKLVASTFFFEKEPIKQVESGFQCTGMPTITI
jgi:patatin-like phospholipase/acyl hydrolase